MIALSDDLIFEHRTISIVLLAFLTVSILHISPVCAQTVSLVTPGNNGNLTNASDIDNIQYNYNFTYVSLDIEENVSTVWLVGNFTGVNDWTVVASNATPYQNDTICGINYTVPGDAIYKWNIIINDVNGSNYTATSNWTFRVDTTAPSYSDNIDDTPTYYNNTNSSILRINWTDLNDIKTVYIEINYSNGTLMNYTPTNTGDRYYLSVVMPIGSHSWKSYASDDLPISNWVSTPTWSFSILSNAPMWKSNGTTVASGATYLPGRDYSFYVNITDIDDNLAGVYFETNLTTGGALQNITTSDTSRFFNFTNNTAGIWWINFTQENFAKAGDFVYRWVAYDAMGSYNASDQWTYSIVQNSSLAPTISIMVNGSTANVAYDSNQTVNLTATIDLPGYRVGIYSNLSDWTAVSGVNSTERSWSLINNGGNYSVVGYFLDQTNYTATSNDTIYLNVTDYNAPTYFNQAQNTSTPVYEHYVNLSVQWKDADLDYATLYTNETGVWDIKRYYDINGTSNWTVFEVQFLNVIRGTGVSWYVVVNDTSNRTNETVRMNMSIKNANGDACTEDFHCLSGICCDSSCSATSCSTGATTTTSPATSSPAITDATTTTSTTTTTTTLPVVEEKILLETLKSGEGAEFEFTKHDTFKIQQVTITPNVDISFMEVTLKNTNKPSGASDPVASDKGKVLMYIELTKQFFSDDNITEAKIDFKVEKSWLTTNGIGQDTVRLYRYSGSEWEELTTTETSDDSTYVYYQATTSKLSIFAITGLVTETPIAEATAAGGDEETLGEEAGQEGSGFKFPSLKSLGLSNISTTNLIIIVIIIIAAVIVVLIKMDIIEVTKTEDGSTGGKADGRPSGKKRRWRDMVSLQSRESQ